MRRTHVRRIRWLAFGVAAILGAWLAYRLGGALLAFAGTHPVAGLRILVGAYAALAVGYFYSAGVSRVAPGHRYTVAVGLVFAVLGVAAGLMFSRVYPAGPLPTVLLGTSLVVGAVGYALQVRGFSETISGSEE